VAERRSLHKYIYCTFFPRFLFTPKIGEKLAKNKVFRFYCDGPDYQIRLDILVPRSAGYSDEGGT